MRFGIGLRPHIDPTSVDPFTRLITWSFAINTYAARHSDGATIFRIYPHVALSITLSRVATIFADLKPEVVRSTVQSLVEEYPYIVTAPELRHADVKTSFTTGIRFQPTKMFRGQIGISYQRIRDFPLLIDRSYSRVWDVRYGGTTDIFSFAGEVVWHWRGISYLTVSWMLREGESTKNSPRIPSRIGITVLHQLLERLDAEFSSEILGPFTYVEYGTQNPTASIQTTFRYSITEHFRPFITVSTPLSQRNESWKGYRIQPFTIQAGVIVQW